MAAIELGVRYDRHRSFSWQASPPICSGRAALVAENGLLHQQLIVAERKLLERIPLAPEH